jgi:hypothetical protein
MFPKYLNDQMFHLYLRFHSYPTGPIGPRSPKARPRLTYLKFRSYLRSLMFHLGLKYLIVLIYPTVQ